MNEIEILNAALAVGWVKFAYFKADGTRRLAIGTRNRALIEHVLGRKLKDNGSDGSFYRNCNGYFDLTRVDWRQFKSERFIGILFDKLTNVQAVSHAIALSVIGDGLSDETMRAANRLIGEIAMPIFDEIGSVYSKTQTDEDEINATDEILAVVEERMNERSVSPIFLGVPSVECAMELKSFHEERTAKVNSHRAALKAELAELRKREDEILEILLAD